MIIHTNKLRVQILIIQASSQENLIYSVIVHQDILNSGSLVGHQNIIVKALSFIHCLLLYLSRMFYITYEKYGMKLSPRIQSLSIYVLNLTQCSPSKENMLTLRISSHSYRTKKWINSFLLPTKLPLIVHLKMNIKNTCKVHLKKQKNITAFKIG